VGGRWFFFCSFLLLLDLCFLCARCVAVRRWGLVFGGYIGFSGFEYFRSIYQVAGSLVLFVRGGIVEIS